jgi:4-hydroxybenzoate polyprenyltransferase
MKKLKYIFFSLRPRQWIKNLFIFLPLVFGKKLFSYPDNLMCLAAFILFSLTSGVVYLVNDIVDVKKDRLHPTKRLRPIASGKISVKEGVIAAIILGAVVLAASFMLHKGLCSILLVYIAFNLLYSKIFKNAVIFDVFCLGAFFFLRLAAGSVVTGVKLSHWIIFMTMLLALFLGFTKRRQELAILGRPQAIAHRSILMQYNTYFIDQMVSVVTASIVVVYMLYTVDARTVNEFQTEHLIYTIPFVYYGIFRYLYLIHQLRKDGDPTRILMSDNKMQLDLAAWVIITILVVYLHL